MTQTTEDKARALVNEVLAETNKEPLPPILGERLASHEALCRLIEQHEAYKQEVSDAVEHCRACSDPEAWTRIKFELERFIIAKPTVDPLVEALNALPNVCGDVFNADDAANLREALAKRGLKIVETFTRPDNV